VQRRGQRSDVDLPADSVVAAGPTCQHAGMCQPTGTARAARRLQHPSTVAIRYSLDRIHRRLITHADGVLTFHDIDAHLDVEQRNRELDLPELFDARGATTNLTTEQVHRLVGRAANMLRLTDLGPTAIVTTNDVLYGMARMYAVLAEGAGAPADVFSDVVSATRWLNEFNRD
jgi:hypothetical protein